MADYNFPEKLRYTDHDEWARLDDGRVTVGISDYAQEQLGDIVFVELPELGSHLNRGERFGVIESVKAVADLFTPIAGEVVEVNADLAEVPEAVNEDCYGDGWMIAITPDAPSDVDGLLEAAAYARHVEAREE